MSILDVCDKSLVFIRDKDVCTLTLWTRGIVKKLNLKGVVFDDICSVKDEWYIRTNPIEDARSIEVSLQGIYASIGMFPCVRICFNIKPI